MDQKRTPNWDLGLDRSQLNIQVYQSHRSIWWLPCGSIFCVWHSGSGSFSRSGRRWCLWRCACGRVFGRHWGRVALQRQGGCVRGWSTVHRLLDVKEPDRCLVLLNWRGQLRSSVVKPYLECCMHGFKYHKKSLLPNDSSYFLPAAIQVKWVKWSHV